MSMDEENIIQDFLCMICYDLVFKPVVLACGHAFCVWCTHESMSLFKKNTCPICRKDISHLPCICKAFDLLLLTSYPRSYDVKRKESKKEEKEKGYFTMDAYDSDIQYEKYSDGSLVVSVNCNKCNQILFRPVVLNCGHVFCWSCITPQPTNGEVTCPECGCLHPGVKPNVCSHLNGYLSGKYGEYYAKRGAEEGKVLPVNEIIGPSSVPWYVYGTKIHLGIGCDACGKYPIEGDRYSCTDCEERAGYHLCAACRDSNFPKPAGRFNQKHSQEHVMKLETEAAINKLLDFVRRDKYPF